MKNRENQYQLNSLIKIFVIVCLFSTSILTVSATDSSDAQKQLDEAKQRVTAAEAERAVFGSEITAFDFIKYHAEQNQDQDAEKYIAEHQKTDVDPIGDESLDELKAGVQYIADINSLRTAASLQNLKISDEYMLAAADARQQDAAALSQYNIHREEVIQGSTVLSEDMSSDQYAATGAAENAMHTEYEVVLGSSTSYDVQDYQKALTSFIQTYITDYETALDDLKTAQAAYDAASAAEKTEKSYLGTEASASPSASPSASASATAAATATPTASPTASPSPSAAPIAKVEYDIMYRLYNPNSGEHFYTASVYEKNSLIDIGWLYEGSGWKAPKSSSTPVYRLYNPNAGDHHYTVNVNEKDSLVSVGWNYEGIGWYSDDAEGVPLYRQYNPNAKAGAHNYTVNANERDNLVSLGWNDEGIGWYGVSGLPYMEGIDISEFNGNIDLGQYRNGFVIIRAGWGDAVTDEKFLRNVQLCEQLQIPYGLYLYSYAITTKEAASEADFFISLIKQCHPTVGVWMDVEGDKYKDKYAPNYAAELAPDIIRTFCSRVKSAGYHIGVYASKNWWDNYLTSITEYDRWLAWYHENDGSYTDERSEGASIYQYTSAYVDPTTGKNLDRDVMYADISSFSK